MSDETYNGWKNRETWALMLHVNNDRSLQEIFHDAMRESIREDGDNMYIHADAMKDTGDVWFTFTGYNEETGDMPSLELARVIEDIGSLWRVDWEEVAKHIYDDVREDIDEDPEPIDVTKLGPPSTWPAMPDDEDDDAADEPVTPYYDENGVYLIMDDDLADKVRELDYSTVKWAVQSSDGTIYVATYENPKGLPPGFYGYKENDLGQHTSYRFATEEDAFNWADRVTEGKDTEQYCEQCHDWH